MQRKGSNGGSACHSVSKNGAPALVKLDGKGLSELSLGKVALLEIDVQGWRQAKEKLKNSLSIFILPPSVETLWKRLFELKFYEYADNISAAWIWTRIKRVGISRKSLFQEELGYIEGGSEVLIEALVGVMADLDAGIFQVGPQVSSGPAQRDSGAFTINPKDVKEDSNVY